MRVLLAIALLLAAVLAWVVWGLRGPERTVTHHAPPPTAYPLPETQEPAEVPAAGRAAPAAEDDDVPVVRVDVTSVTATAPQADGIPVDVILVDGETGAVLRKTDTAVARGTDVGVAYDVAAPPGYVADPGESGRAKARSSRLAVRARVVVPVRREADIRVHVIDDAGRSVQGASLDGVYVGRGLVTGSGEECSVGAPVPSARAGPSGADGWMRLHGVPHLLDERYRIIVSKDEARGSVNFRLGDFGERRTLEIRLGPAPRPQAQFLGLGGGAGGSTRGRGGRRVLRAPATLDVVVVCRDGRMGDGLRIRAGSTEKTTDAFGRATFEGMQPGVYDIAVNDPDFTWSVASVDLAAGERRTFVLSERPGWTAHVLLLDSEGRSVPFASVLVSSGAPVPYLRVVDGIQDLVFFTDANGEIRLPDMHHAPVQLTFRYGSRSKTVTIEEESPYRTVQLPPP